MRRELKTAGSTASRGVNRAGPGSVKAGFQVGSGLEGEGYCPPRTGGPCLSGPDTGLDGRAGPRGHMKNEKNKAKKGALGAGFRAGPGRAVDGGGSVHPGPDIPGRAKNRAGRRPGRANPARLTPLSTTQCEKFV